MDLAYLAEADEQEFRFAAIDGDGASFGGVAAELRIPRHDTLCDRMLAGAIPNAIGDVSATPGASDAVNASAVGAYVGVPVRLGDGRVYGSLCCVSHGPATALAPRDVKMLEVLARLDRLHLAFTDPLT
ncbi:MAG TPA: GAF domain-containing protein, partial [Solirubrobacteraceae bacterium]|nr:GAF domain-containing protein [Solirubrobacteraceae bacterium]